LPPPVYQQIAANAKQLRELGMSYRAVARALGVNDKTVAKAIVWQDSARWSRRPADSSPLA
jgi:DNA invertase Pin-like site-specific DNA recombinase